jgi:hypothetical protein
MRKFRKHVNRNGWMARLQRYVLGELPKYSGYCPFFWMTWACLLVLPVAVVIKTIRKVKPERVVITSKFLNEVREYYGWNGKQATMMFYAKDKRFRKLVEMYGRKWIENLTPTTPKPKEPSKLKPVVEKIARSMKRFMIGVSLGGFVGGIGVGLYFVIPILLALPASSWIALLEGVAFVLGFLGLVFCFSAFLTFLARKTRFFASIGSGLEWIGLGIWKCILAMMFPISFMRETISQCYTTNCPLIEWSDHNSPIERI